MSSGESEVERTTSEPVGQVSPGPTGPDRRARLTGGRRAPLAVSAASVLAGGPDMSESRLKHFNMSSTRSGSFCHKISAKLEFLVSFQNVVVLWDGYVKCGSFLSITLNAKNSITR